MATFSDLSMDQKVLFAQMVLDWNDMGFAGRVYRMSEAEASEVAGCQEMYGMKLLRPAPCPTCGKAR